MRKIRKYLYWLGLLVGISILIWQIIDIFTSVGSNRPPFLSPGLLITAWASLVILIYLQMVNWQLILFGSGSQIGIQELVRGYTLSLIPRYIPGSVWGFISRGEWLHQTYSVPYSVVSYCTIVEVLVTVITSLMVIGFFFGTSGQLTVINSAFILLLVFLLPFLVWLLIDGVVHFLVRRKQKRTSGTELKNIPLHVWLMCTMVYIGQWLVLGVSILLINGIFYTGASVLQSFTLHNLNIATYAFSLAWLAGFLILFVPGGIGVRELILSSILVAHLAIANPQAALIALLSRGLYFLAEIFWIGAGLTIDMAAKKRNVE